MKDKLEKTGHRKAYHAARRMMLAFFLVLGVFAAGAIPVGISYQAGVAAQAERENSSSYSIDEQEQEESSSYAIEEN